MKREGFFWDDPVCLIVDSCVVAQVINAEPDTDYFPVLQWLLSRTVTGKIVMGGGLGREATFQPGTHASRFLRQLRQAGRLRRISDDEVDQDERIVIRLGICRSNDTHVIALARVSGARVLCTNDGNLMQDMANRALVSRPRGKTYRNTSHTHLLGHNSACQAAMRRAQ